MEWDVASLVIGQELYLQMTKDKQPMTNNFELLAALMSNMQLI
jgi:hypothetical protein